MYLIVINLSDITNGDGVRLKRSSYFGKTNECLKIEYIWSIQGYPGGKIGLNVDVHSNLFCSLVYPASFYSLSYQLNEWDGDIGQDN